MAEPMILQQRWRTGQKVGRTIYLQDGPEPSDSDQLIGLMDTAWLAETAVDAVNGAARAQQRIEAAERLISPEAQMAALPFGDGERWFREDDIKQALTGDEPDEAAP